MGLDQITRFGRRHAAARRPTLSLPLGLEEGREKIAVVMRDKRGKETGAAANRVGWLPSSPPDPTHEATQAERRERESDFAARRTGVEDDGRRGVSEGWRRVAPAAADHRRLPIDAGSGGGTVGVARRREVCGPLQQTRYMTCE